MHRQLGTSPQCTREPDGRTRGRAGVAGLLVFGLVGGLAAGLATVSGCAARNPFSDHPDDYAREVALSRLREIRADRLAEHRADRVRGAEAGAAAGATEDATDGANASGAEGTPDTALPAARAPAAESAELTLERCRAGALANNLDLSVALVDPTIARERANEEEARFERAFTLSTRWRELDSPTSSDLASSTLSQQTIEPGVRVPLRTGGTATIALPISRSEDSNQFSTLNPAYSSDLAFSISHPLLRGAGRRIATAPIRIAGFESQASEARTKLEVIRQLAAVDRAYWRLYEARANLDVSQRQLELAQAQRDRAQRRVDAGAAPEVEALRAESGVADRLDAILRAKADVLQRQRELKRLVNDPALPVESDTMIIPSSPPDPVEYAFDRAALTSQAVEERMEMLELELALAADAVRVMLDRDATLPLVTLDYTYRVNGLGRSLPRSVDTMADNRFEDWELGLSADIPVGNEQARSRLRATILQRLQRLQTKAAREQSIRREVLDAADALDAAWQRILAARQSVILNTRTFQAEQRQFDADRATSTDVLDAASRLSEAQLAEVRAITDYQIAQVDLAFATGTLLGASRVEWTPRETVDIDRELDDGTASRFRLVD